MSRIQSLKREVEISGKTIYPNVIGAFPPGGKDVIGEHPDGNDTYSFKTGQKVIPTIEVVVNKKADRYEYDTLMDFANSNTPEDVFIKGRNNSGVEEETFCLTECLCAIDDNSGADRSNSDPDTQKFLLLPKNIVPVR